MSDFLFRALLAIIVLSFLVGPLGSVAIWRRFGYFGDAAAHASLLGVAIALFFDFHVIIGTGVIAVGLGFYLSAQSEQEYASDGLLGVIAHGGLALALVLLSLNPSGRGNLEGYLFGDVLTVTSQDLRVFLIASIAILLLLFWRWQRILYSTLNAEMAAARGISAEFEGRIYTVLLALAVAMGIQIVGALLMGAFLVIPAMIARCFARSPESMVLLSIVFALCSGIGGLVLSYYGDIPTAPAMVVVSVTLFMLSMIKNLLNF